MATPSGFLASPSSRPCASWGTGWGWRDEAPASSALARFPACLPTRTRSRPPALRNSRPWMPCNGAAVVSASQERPANTAAAVPSSAARGMLAASQSFFLLRGRFLRESVRASLYRKTEWMNWRPCRYAGGSLFIRSSRPIDIHAVFAAARCCSRVLPSESRASRSCVQPML